MSCRGESCPTDRSLTSLQIVIMARNMPCAIGPAHAIQDIVLIDLRFWTIRFAETC
jgi:hypothetical protein